MKSFWNGREVLVTGAGGFIGSHLVETLVRQGAIVTALLHYDIRVSKSNLDFVSPEVMAKVKVVSGDICDAFFMRKIIEGKDTVFHLAALIAIPYSYLAPASYVRTNIEGTLNVLQAAKDVGVRRMIHTSTSEVYGTAIYTPIDEKHPLQGQSPYSASKIGADKLVESYYNSFNVPVVTLRPFNTYGPRQSARAVIPTVISQCYSEFDTIKLGDLSPVRDMNYVQDTANAFLAAGQADECIGMTLNAGSGVGFTIKEIAEMIMKVTGVSKKIVEDSDRIRPPKSEVFKLVAESSKLTKVTGWRPQTNLEQGLSRTAEFVKGNMNQFNVGKYEV